MNVHGALNHRIWRLSVHHVEDRKRTRPRVQRPRRRRVTVLPRVGRALQMTARRNNSFSLTDNLKKAGWSWGCVAAMDCDGRTIWSPDTHRGDGKRFVGRADEKLTAFLELESAILQLRKRQRCTSISVVCRFSHFADYGERAD